MSSTMTNGRLGLCMALFFAAWCAPHSQITHGASCKTKIFKEKIDKSKIISIQKSVIDGHQPWRLDARVVAQQAFVESPDLIRANVDRSGPPLIQTLDSEQNAVFAYESTRQKLKVEITVHRFAWLLPISHKWEWTIWTPTEIRLTACKTN